MLRPLGSTAGCMVDSRPARNVGVMVRFTQSARKHRTGRAHAPFVMDTSEPTVLEEPDQPRRLVWLGADDR